MAGRRNYYGRYEDYRTPFDGPDQATHYATREAVEAALAAGTKDFREASLAGLRLNGLDFSGCDLTYADLSDSRLSSDTNLTGATLYQTRLVGTNAENANFSVAANTRNMRCQDAYLRYANFEGLDLTGCDFTHANLFSARFERALARYVRFEHAELQYAHFNGTDIMGSAFTHADLRRADFTLTRVDKSSHEIMAALILAHVEADRNGWGTPHSERNALTRHRMIAGLVLLEQGSCWREIGEYLGALDGPTAEADRQWLHEVFDPYRELGLGDWIALGDRAYRIALARANGNEEEARAVKREATPDDEDYDPDDEPDEDEDDDSYGDDDSDEDDEPDEDEDEDESTPEQRAAQEAVEQRRHEARQRAYQDSTLGASDGACNCYLCRGDRAWRAEEARAQAAAEAQAAQPASTQVADPNQPPYAGCPCSICERLRREQAQPQAPATSN